MMDGRRGPIERAVVVGRVDVCGVGASVKQMDSHKIVMTESQDSSAGSVSAEAQVGARTANPNTVA